MNDLGPGLAKFGGEDPDVPTQAVRQDGHQPAEWFADAFRHAIHVDASASDILDRNGRTRHCVW